MNIKWFPYDEQKCTLVFASTIYPIEYLKYVDHFDKAYTFVLESFVENKQWELVKYTYEFKVKVYKGYPDNYSEMHVHLYIRRKPLYIITNLMVPALFLSVITLILFFIPFAQAVPIGMSVVLAYSVLAIRLIFKKV